MSGKFDSSLPHEVFEVLLSPEDHDMNVDVSYSAALAAYPDQVATLIAKLRAGKSKERNVTPEDLTWRYQWCLSVRSFSFTDLLVEAHQPGSVPCDDDSLQGTLDRVSVALQATRGRWWASTAVPSIPSEVHTAVVAHVQYRAQPVEDASPEDMAKAVDTLTRMGGFVAIKLTK